MRALYSALYYCLLPGLVLRMLWRSRLARGYRQRLPERCGYFTGRSDIERPAIWVHAVSVGETLAAAPLVEALLRHYPGYPVVLTTTTPTGSERVRALFGDRVFHVYAPWDLPGSLRRFLHRTRPALLLLMETELWPNMLHYCGQAGCRVVLANARLSARSARGYAGIPGLTRRMLYQLDAVACQSVADGERFLTLGLPGAALTVTGNIKFDVAVDAGLQQRAGRLRDTLEQGGRPVLVAASTHAGEEELILSAYSRIREQCGPCLLVLAPRHPERFDGVRSLCRERGWRVGRRSAGGPAMADDILLLDTMGELLLLLGTATVAVVGGSLLAHGGHNPLEAAAWGVPVVAGPHMENFTEVSELLAAAGAMLRLENPAELGQSLSQLLADPAQCRRMGAAGRQVLAQNRGASERLLQLVALQLARGW